MLGTLSRRRGLRRAITPEISLRFWFLTSALEGFDVLGAGGQLGDGLHEGYARLLVGFEGGKHCTGHAIY